MILPLALAPNFILTLVAEVGPVPSKTSTRFNVIFTGEPPDFFESIAAIGSE